MDEVIRKERLREGFRSLGDVMVWDSSRRISQILLSSHFRPSTGK